MMALVAMMSMALAVLLALVLAPGEAYETRVNHSPWWAYEKDLNSVENSYQYYYPYYHQQQQHKKNNFRWNYPTRDQVRKKKVDNNRWKYPSSSFNKDRRKNTFDWNNYLPSVDFNRIKMPNFPTTRRPAMTKPAMTTREWPAYHLLPPVRMISPSLDEPPQP